MSYYLALFGPDVDLEGIAGLRALTGAQLPKTAARTMSELAVAYALVGARMIVDETGDTSHELASEPWEPPCEADEGGEAGQAPEDVSARLESTRLGALAKRAESAGAALAIWDACWDEPSSGPATLVTSYADWRERLSGLDSVWDIGGLLCIPQAGAGGPRGAPVRMPVDRPALRDPRVRLGLGLCAGLALAVGVGLEVGVRLMLRDLSWLPSDVAALRTAAGLTGLAVFVGGACLILAAVFLQALRRAIAEQRVPPSGATGPAGVVTGRAAVLLGRVGMGLALVLGLAGLALWSYAAWLARSVVACAAKNL